MVPVPLVDVAIVQYRLVPSLAKTTNFHLIHWQELPSCKLSVFV